MSANAPSPTASTILQSDFMIYIIHDGSLVVHAILWVFLTLGFRILIVSSRVDSYHTGLLPVLASFVSDFFDFDPQWVRAYSSLRVGLLGSLINLSTTSVDVTELGHTTGSKWIKLTVLDSWTYITSRVSHAFGRVPPLQGALPAPSLLLHQAQLWFRCPRAFHRLATLLEWKHFFWVYPPNNTPTVFSSSQTLRRLSDDSLPNDFHSLDTVNEETINRLLGDSEGMLLIYGLNVVLIPKQLGEIMQPDEGTTKRAFVASVLTALCVAGSMIHSKSVDYWPFLAVALVPVVLDFLIHGRSEAQKVFFGHASMHIEQIELASRHLVRRFGTSGRTIDVRLCYKGVQAWCRCQPTPVGDPATNNTWVEVMIPSTFPNLGRSFELFDVLIHTVLPWGHSNNWGTNLVYASITLYASSISKAYGALGIGLALIAIVFAPLTIFGDGDPWTLAWYVWAGQIISKGGIYLVLADSLNYAKDMFFTPPS